MMGRKRLCVVLMVVMAALSLSCGGSKYMIKQQPDVSKGYEANSCRVVFIRPVRVGFAVTPVIITSEGKYLGESIAKSYFAASLPAGKYTFIVDGENTHALKANLKAGKTYYVRLLVHFGTWSPRFHLVAYRPGAELWEEKDKFIADCEFYMPDREAGQKNVVDARAEDMKKLIEDGLKRFESYTDAEKKERTLNPEDGV